MNWGRPELLAWLPAVGAAAWAAWAGLGRRARAVRKLAGEETLEAMAPGWDEGAWKRRWAWRAAAVGLAWLALARPQWGVHWEDVRQRGLDLAVVMDTSRSMEARDMAPSRLQQAKWGVRDLLGRLKGDRVALVPFAGSSVVQCPLTTDYAAFGMTLDDLYCGIIPRGGTAIAQALQTAMDALPEEEGGADRAILLITDGEDHEGDPMALAGELKRRGIRVYAIGIGTLAGEMVPGADGQGYFKNRQGQVVQTTLHEEVLQRLALETGGAYVRSAPGDTGLARVFEESIAKLTRDERETRQAEVREERFAWALAAALACLAGEAAVRGR
ncbi:MAG: VWA domain-containing protein, partial [Kiritimatiellae bacterium]|nr:VWA domain-containing protein [Kiritimatiellia bacterium]